MGTGTDGRMFMLLQLTAFVMTCVATMSVSINNFAIDYGAPLPDSFTSVRYALHTTYLFTRNIFSPMFIVYIISLTDRWHKLRSSGLMVAAYIIPAAFVTALLVLNLFSDIMFGFDITGAYTRGSCFFLMYVTAAIYMIGGTVYLIKVRKLIKRFKFFALMSLYPLNVIAVAIQFVHPDAQVEMFVNAISLMLITIFVQRPEDIIDSTTKLRHSISYAEDMNLNFANDKHVEIIVINVSNLDSIMSMLDYENSSELLDMISRKVEATAAKYKLISRCYYLTRGKFRIVNSGSRENTFAAAEEINSFFRSGIIINRLELNLLAHICILRCPEDIGDFKSLIDFGNDFHEKIPYSGNVMSAAELTLKNSFRLSRNLDKIIERAIANGNFKIYYQPIYSIEKQRFTSAEALLRLIDDEYGFVPPDIFIPAAEKSGAIHRIGDFVLEDVCRFIGSPEYKKLGLEYIEINLSVAQCMQTDLADKVMDIVRRYGISPSQINLEITETAANFAQNIMTSNVDKLISEGISFSLDDYGTGYSNIKSVASLPLSIVKLDKTFADEMSNSKMQSVLKDTIRMLKNLDMHIVVEGIETKEMLQHFNDLKCDYIQGYYFSKPIPEKDFIEFIFARNA